MSIRFNPLIFAGLDLSGGGAAGAAQWKPPVADESYLPTSGNSLGDVRVVISTSHVYVWDDSNNRWVDTSLNIDEVGIAPAPEGMSLSIIDEVIGSVTIGINS